MNSARVPEPARDFVQPFQIEAPGLRGRLVRLESTVEAALAGHDYPPEVAAMLAEALAMAAVLASGLKYDGIFTLQMQGDGPVPYMVTDVTSDGDMRGYARVEADRMETAARGLEGAVPRLFGSGRMSFTVDQGPATERYQGITPLEGATLSDCAHAYFRHSEQLQTAIRLCASDMSRDGEAPRAAALMIQRLPATDHLLAEDEEDDWRRAVVLMSSATSAELMSSTLPPADLLYRLFHEDGVRVFRRRALRHNCRCSLGRVERTLRAFPPDQLASLMDDGVLRVTCEFCKSEYAFDEAALRALREGGPDEN